MSDAIIIVVVVVVTSIIIILKEQRLTQLAQVIGYVFEMYVAQWGILKGDSGEVIPDPVLLPGPLGQEFMNLTLL